MTEAIKLAIAAGAALRRLRRGEAVVGAFRADLMAVLLAVVTVTAGRSQPPRQNDDPGTLIDAAVTLCRASGMSGRAMAERFNDAIEKAT